MNNINTVGVVGAGTMGAALAQKFAQEGFEVVLADREQRFVDRALTVIRASLDEAVEKNVIAPNLAGAVANRIHGTAELGALSRCQLVVEAIYEDFNAKAELFGALSGILNPEAIIATNTSSFSVGDLSRYVRFPERFVGLHFFYHAAKNRLVEIIPGEKTSKQTLQLARLFSVKSGKDAILCADAYGFVVNRFFVPWLNEAVRLLAEGVATIDEIDQVSMQTFGIGMGPFALMNATGIPVAYHAEKTLEAFGKPYVAAEMLRQQALANTHWATGEPRKADILPDTADAVRTRLLGIVFYVVAQILDEKVCTPADINRGARIGLKWAKGPVDMMLDAGETEVRRLIAAAITDRHDVPMPRSVTPACWRRQYVQMERVGPSALITLNRPEDLNALNEAVIDQLDEQFAIAENDPDVKNILITGSGKAFVAGADIKFFLENMKNGTPENIVGFTRKGQNVFSRIDGSSKKVVMLLNGLALGGGLELALSGDVILAIDTAKMAFPETGIGIYPALGGTFRTCTRVGKGLAKYLVCTGAYLSAAEAEKIGFIDKRISQDEMLGLLNGDISPDAYQARRRGPADSRYAALAQLFERYTTDELLEDSPMQDSVPADITAEIRKKLSQKAPIAIKISEKLIDDNSGDKEVLDQVNSIFSTSDAYLGLSSIGKKVQYEGK